MKSILAGQTFDRIPQIEPDELRTMEDVAEAVKTIHDELDVESPIALLIKKELKLFEQSKH